MSKRTEQKGTHADIFVEEIEFLNVKNNAESSKSKMTEVTDIDDDMDSLPF